MSHLSFSLLQTALHWEDKTANLQMLEQKINAIQHSTQIVVLPEMFSTGFSMNPAQLAEEMNGPTVDWMKRIAAQHRIIVTGSIIIKEDDHYYNRLIWMLPNGQLAWYDKRHLFAFAGEDKHYNSGSKRLIASVNGWKINVQVCYDLRFPVWARQASSENPEYDVLIYVANWPERRQHAWRSLLIARAIENQCYVIGVNRVGKDGNDIDHSGNSMVVDAMGEVLYEKQHEEDVHTITLSKEKLEEVRSRLPFLKDADAFQILL
ncbi:MAG TPA: amidohydrolase [Lacibacter sp.]|nr:amidohydrolase [Lacibacter sp.]